MLIHAELHVIVGIWVDDSSTIGPNNTSIKTIKQMLGLTFEMKDEGLIKHYLGLQVDQSEEGFRVHLETYAHLILQKFNLHYYYRKKVPIQLETVLGKGEEDFNETTRTEFQRKDGSLGYLTERTRPEISFLTYLCARYSTNPSSEHINTSLRLTAFMPILSRSQVEACFIEEA